MAMLAILPGCDESDDSDSQSENGTNGSEVKNLILPTYTDAATRPVENRDLDENSIVSPHQEGAVNSHSIAPGSPTTSGTELADGVSRSSSLSSGHLASGSGLNIEQKSVLKFLALKRRKDEELRQLEEAKREEEGRRQARKRGRKRQRNANHADGKTELKGGSDDGTPTEDMKKLSSYLGINDHLRGAMVDHGELGPKCGLEKEIDQAVASGDVDRAEQLSNYLASRNFGARVAEAANARDYDKQKQEEEQQRLAKKQQKKARLAWGFEVKHRWEMKGNM